MRNVTFTNGRRNITVQVTSVAQYVDAIRRMNEDGFTWVKAVKVVAPTPRQVSMDGKFGVE